MKMRNIFLLLLFFLDANFPRYWILHNYHGILPDNGDHDDVGHHTHISICFLRRVRARSVVRICFQFIAFPWRSSKSNINDSTAKTDKTNLMNIMRSERRNVSRVNRVTGENQCAFIEKQLFEMEDVYLFPSKRCSIYSCYWFFFFTCKQRKATVSK